MCPKSFPTLSISTSSSEKTTGPRTLTPVILDSAIVRYVRKTLYLKNLYYSHGLQPNSDGLQPRRDGHQPKGCLGSVVGAWGHVLVLSSFGGNDPACAGTGGAEPEDIEDHGPDWTRLSEVQALRSCCSTRVACFLVFRQLPS